MRYPVLLVSDPHFTSNPKDEYRWGLWAWLRKECKERGVRTVVWCGDLSDAKDFHPSSLVNRLALEVKECAQLARQYLIPGNHEWLKRGEEFWRFLAHMGENIHYFTQPADDPVPHKDGPTTRFLPFTKTPARDWAGMSSLEDYDLVFMHQTVKGSRSSNGQEMEGEDVPLELLKTAGYVFSGDIHVPQQIPGTKNMEYVGSPYHVHFGDSFRPRCVLLPAAQHGTWLDLHFPTVSRVTLDVGNLEDLELDAGRLRAGDQVKVRMRLGAGEKHEWKRIRRDALAMLAGGGLSVHGLEMIVVGANGQPASSRALPRQRQGASPQDDVLRYVLAEELGPSALDAAMEVLG